MTIDENGVPNTTSIDRAALAPPKNSIASVVDERNPVRCEREISKNQHQAPEGEVAERERFDTDNTDTHLNPAASEKIDAHKPCEFRNRDVGDEKIDRRECAVEALPVTYDTKSRNTPLRRRREEVKKCLAAYTKKRKRGE